MVDSLAGTDMGMPPSGLVNWHQGRCGSSVLGSILGQHSAIKWENEVFSRYMPRRRGDAPVPIFSDVMNGVLSRRSKPFQLIEVKYLEAQNLGLYPDLDLRGWLESLVRHGFTRHLLLHRRNGLRRIVSHLMAQRSGVYVLRGSSRPAVTNRPLQINCGAITEGFQTNSLLKWLEIYESSFHCIKMQLEILYSVVPGASVCEIFYEDDIERDPFSGYEKVCVFLGLKSESPTIDLRRINLGSLSGLIANYAEVECLLADTRFSWMLGE